MRFAANDDMIETLTPDRADQPFDKGRCNRLVPDAHGAQSTRDDGAEDPSPIANEVSRSLIPWKGLRYLVRNPLRGRICCNVDPDEVSAV
jgi:hypothetical protein